MDLPASVANKRLTFQLNPLDATLTKNQGWGYPPRLARRSDVSTFRPVNGSSVHPPCFLHLTATPPQRLVPNSFGINPLRALFLATEGVPPYLLISKFRRCDVQTFRRSSLPLGRSDVQTCGRSDVFSAFPRSKSSMSHIFSPSRFSFRDRP